MILSDGLKTLLNGETLFYKIRFYAKFQNKILFACFILRCKVIAFILVVSFWEMETVLIRAKFENGVKHSSCNFVSAFQS